MALPDDKCGGLPRLCLSAEPRNGHTRPAATSNKVKDFHRKRRQRSVYSPDRRSSLYSRAVSGTRESAEWCCADASRYLRVVRWPAANLKRRSGAMGRCLASGPVTPRTIEDTMSQMAKGVITTTDTGCTCSRMRSATMPAM